jgi:peptidoglycan/LPS O-acetylase OafA/YrhL
MQSILENNNKRLYGLDTLRAAAIILVLMYHYKVFVSHENTFGFITQIGWTGVDLFFVLSGYLIGNQILSAFSKNQNFSLRLFYIRRFLRTLPNYYVVLALYFFLPGLLSGSATAPLWAFLTFTQNIGMHPGETFTHSWSLCIEEQFYLLFPVVALLVASTKRSITLAWIVIVTLMIFCALLRSGNWYNYGQAAITATDYWQHIYYSSFTRFDELLPGVAIALFKNFHPHAFSKLLQKGNLLLIMGLASTTIMFYTLANYFYIDGYGFSLLIAAFGYTFLSISFALLVLAALSPNTLLHRVRIPFASHLAIWSYAIYLIHRPLFTVLIEQLGQHGINVKNALGTSIIMGVSILCGWLLYQFIETPFMKLREKYYPANTITVNSNFNKMTTDSV